jgi:amino acid transporter
LACSLFNALLVAVPMVGTLAFFLFGFAAGVVLLRLGRKKPLRPWERKLLPPLGWVVMSACFALAALLLAWGLFERLR